VEQLGTHRMDFNEILCLRISRKPVKKSQVSLQFDMSNSNIRDDPYKFMAVSRSIPLRLRNVSINFFPKITP